MATASKSIKQSKAVDGRNEEWVKHIAGGNPTNADGLPSGGGSPSIKQAKPLGKTNVPDMKTEVFKGDIQERTLKPVERNLMHGKQHRI